MDGGKVKFSLDKKGIEIQNLHKKTKIRKCPLEPSEPNFSYLICAENGGRFGGNIPLTSERKVVIFCYKKCCGHASYISYTQHIE